MITRRAMLFFWVVFGTAECGTNGVVRAQSTTAAPQAKPRARVTFSHALPKLDGAHLTTTVLEVNYGPGESSTPHTHVCAVVGYVTQGAIRTKVEGQPIRVVRTGETFFEAPNKVHLISENASRAEPASFLAFFICDHDAPLSMAPGNPGQGEHR